MATAMAEIERWKRLTASERAHELNEATRASLREGESAFLLTEDAAHWASCRIHTGFDLERALLIGSISDTHKELHGFRPRWDFDSFGFTELERKLQSLCEAVRDDEPAGEFDDEWHSWGRSDREDFHSDG